MAALNKFKMTKLYERDLPRNKKDTVIKIFRKDKKMIDNNDVDTILAEFKKKDKHNRVQIMIRGRTKLDMTTYKGFDQEIVHWDNEYWLSRGEDLMESYYLEITLRK